jgi:hypothetical protein
MKKIALALMILPFAIPSALAQTGGGKWRTGFGQGILEISVSNGPGNEFRIDCDLGATEDASRTGMSFMIRGRYPPPNSEVRVFIDDTEIQFFMDQEYSSKIDNRSAYMNFVALWEEARTGRSMRVLFSDGRTSTFTLNGARAALGAKPCDTGFSGRSPTKGNRRTR